MLAAAEGEAGVFVVRGRMIDAPLLAHARAITAHPATGAAPTTDEGQ